MAEQITVVIDVIAKMDNAEAGFKKLQGALQKFKLPDNLDSGFKKSFANIESLFAKYKSQLEKGFETKADVSSFVKTSKAIDTELDRLSKHFTELTGKEIDFRIKTDEVKRAEKDIADLALAKEKFGKDTLQLKVEGIKKDELSSVRKALEELQRLTKGNTGKAAGSILEGLDTGNIQQVKKGMDDLLRSFRNVKSESKLIDIKKAFGLDITDVVTKIINTLRGVEGEMDTFNQKTKEASDNLQQVKGNQIAEAGEKLGEAANECERLRGETQKTTAATQEYARATQSMSQQLGDLQQTTQYFFSLRNMINLFKRGIDDAVQSVKELDKAMTETAVVTDFSVADMWKDLPKYTQIANDLGATTQGAYETMTLYYQQGLNQQQAFELGAETMKMARIAGLDYAETTDMMTAALRGFNMELDETSAKRINDVYSKIAAVTASDTEELGTAMQRTASIAHSAGMSFEGTTAFLAQAIETTREPAENLGTAMKTIVARFQEMKKNPLEITEVDGEEVSYNKVDQALQSIGVSLKDTNGQFRELDQVFLDISARWDSLSQTQQRYIATTAAGSRQQSRFIAMMDNYERTMQLMEAANNSAGASDEQFGKTMDSLESKLNKLHNAWQQFTMGIANNAMIKTAVDGLTGFLNITNKLIDKLSLGIGPLKSIISLFAAFTGLKAGGKLINSLIGGLGGLLDPQSSFTKGWLNSSKQNNVGVNNAQAQAISNPIVQAIHQLQSAIIHAPVTTNNQTGVAGATNASSVLYRNVNSAIRQALNTDKLTGSGLIKHLEGLDKTSQRVTMANLTGTQRNLNQNLLGQYGSSIFKKSMPAIQTAFKRIDQKVADESISFTEGYAAKVSPKALLEHLDMNNADEKALADSINTGLENARQKALEKAVRDRAAQQGRRLEDNELAGAIRAFANTDEGKRVAVKAEEGFILDPKIMRTPMQQAMDDLGKFGSGLSGAGMAITSFGSILASTGIPGIQELGMVISKVGSGITALGTALSGASAAVVAFTDTTTASAMANFIKNPITIAVAAASAAILALAAVIKMNNKKIQEAAEKITTDYTEKTSKAKENISNLKQYKEELENLSSGVDERGLNINLDTTDYERYREIVNSIAEMNPNIVKGYNAQGDAIIDNNTALQETLKLQEQINQQATQNYIDPHSLDKLIKARDLNEAFFDPKSIKTGLDADPTRQAAKHLINLFKRSHVQDEFLNQFGLSYDQLAKDENNAIYRFISNHDVMMNSLRARYQATGRDLSQSLIDGFGNLSDAYDAQQEAIEPLYQNLLAYASDKRLTEKFSTEMTTTFNQGLKSIASTRGASGTDMQGAVDKLASLMNNVVGSSKEYQDILSRIKSTQEEWAQDLNDDTYTKQIKDEVDALKDLAQQQRDVAEETNNLSDAERQAYYAMADFLDNQALQALKYIDKTVQDLSSTFNEFSQSITNAGNAYENFENRMENIDNYGDGVKSYKQIYDQIFEETEDSNGRKQQLNIEGIGRPEAWIAAESFFTSDWLSGKDINAVVDRLKEIGPLLEEGQTGAVAFGDAIRNSLLNDKDFKERFGDVFSLNPDGSVNIAENLEPAMMEHIARYWGIQEDLLVSFFNNARQYLPEFTFASSNADIRTALAADTRAYNNIDTGAIFVNRDTLVEAFQQGGTYAQDVIDERITELGTEQQVYAIPELDKDFKLSKEDRDYMTNTMGINKDNFVDSLAPLLTGEEMEQYAGQIFENGEQWWKDTGEGLYDTWSANQESLIEDLASEEGDELPTIASSVSNIEAMMTADLYRSGQMEDTSSLDQMHRAIFGNEGWDTSIQKLKHGADLDLTKEQFEQYYSDATAAVSALSKAEEDLNDGRLQAIKDYGEGSEQVKRYDEAIKQVKSDLEYAQGAITEADQYKETKTWQYDDPSIQQHVNDVISAGWGQLLSGIPVETLATSEAQQAMATIASNAFSPDMVPTEELTNALSVLGLEWNQAALSGMEAWNTAETASTVSEKITEAGELVTNGIQTGLQTGIDQKGEELNQTGEEAGSSMLNKVDTSWVANLASGIVQKYEESVNNNPINIPEITPTVNKGAETVTDIAQQAVAATLTVDTSDSDAKLDATQQKTNEVADTINEGATFTINVPGIDKLNQAATAASNLSKQGGSQTVGVKTSFDAGAVKSGVDAIKGMSAKVQVGAYTKPALDAAESARKTIDSKSATINVSTSVTGQNVHIYVTKHVTTVGDKGPSTGGFITTTGVLYRAKGGRVEYPGYPKKGTDRIPAYLTPGEYVQNRKAVNYFGIEFMRKINHQDLIGALQSFGSAAKGKLGRLGPKNRGGMTLTGELGYEIAWLPKENRSIILGANGPQMVNLPKDAVVYNHEQSKDIMKKQKGISAGSMWGGGTLHTTTSSGYSGGSSSSKSKSSDSTSKKVEKAAKTVEDSAKEATDTIQKAYVWWENIARKTEASQRQQDKNQKEFEKYLKQVGANFINAGKPVSEGGGGGDDLLADMNKTLAYYEAQVKKGAEEKSQLVTGTKEQTAANNIWWRGDHERGYTESQKANKAAYENNILSGAKISYKNGKDTVDEFVNLSGYIRQGADGSLEVVQEWIDGISNLEKRKAVADAANKAADDITNKINKAEDGIEKTKEAIEKMGETLYDTFFKWENELTKIWQITQKIEQAEGRISRLKSYENLLNLQIETGIKQVVDEQGNLTDVSGEMINIFNAGVKELEGEIHLENQNIDEQRAHLEDLVNMSSKMEALEDIQDRLVNSALRPEDQKGNTKGSGGLIDSLIGGLSQEKLNNTSELALLKAAEGLEKDIELQTRAWDFMSATQNADGTLNIDFDSEAFEATKYATGMTTEDAEAIQKYVKDIVETNNNLSSAYDSLTSKMVDMNDKLKTLQDQWVGYAEELWKISEEEQKQEIDNLKKLSDSLTNSLKKLLDEVKRKIDQRRKQEDNAKTELDISKKQQRLASLRADTSGGNQVEIAKLQQEIADAQQNYQRSLEDQLLESLQQQGDLAAQQREQQIALQEATITAVNNAALVNKWMDDPLKYREELFEAYKTANDFDKKPQALQQKLIQDFNKMFGGMITNQTQQETVENGLAATASELKVINDSINSIANKSKENKSKKVTSTGAKSNTKVGDTKKKTDTAKAQAEASKKKSEPAKQSTPKKQTAPSKPQVSKISRDLKEGMRGDDVKILQTALKQLGCTGVGWKPLTIDGYFGPDTASAVREFQRNYKYKASKTLAADGVVGRYSKEAFKALGFKTGGLADYTGPAWLDGTPSKPELVLNATDTQNFLALRDVLSKAIGSTNTVTNSYGGNATYEININVDKLTSDYDVDRVADKVKKIIVKDSGYRNVTQVRNFR